MEKAGAKGESNPRPLAPKARIIPLDHWPESHLRKDEARGIRTPNLRVWNPTRCHCAIASHLGCGQGGPGPHKAPGAQPFHRFSMHAKVSTPRGIRTLNPQIRSLMRYPVAPVGLLRLQKGSPTGI